MNIEVLKKFQKNLFLKEKKEKLVEILENVKKGLKGKEDEKEKIESLIIIENIEENLKIIDHIADQNLNVEQFEEFDEGVIQSFNKKTSENITDLNDAFFEVMYAKIEKMQTVEEIYNEIIKLQEIKSVCQNFEELAERKGGIEQFYQKIRSRIEFLRNQGKTSILPELER